MHLVGKSKGECGRGNWLASGDADGWAIRGRHAQLRAEVTTPACRSGRLPGGSCGLSVLARVQAKAA